MSDRQAKLERARARREEMERQTAAESQRARRMRMLGGAAALAIVVVVIAVIVGSSGGSSSKSKAAPNAGAVRAQSAQISAMFAGIPEHGQTLGNPKAPVTMVEFADLKCPICRDYTLNAFPTLLRDYVRPGKLKIVFEPQTFVGSPPGDSAHAARFALAAAQQDKMWPFAELWYRNQQDENTAYATDSYIRSIAAGVPGLNISQAMSARQSATVSKQLSDASQLFNAAGFSGTPSFLLGKSNQQLKPLNATTDPSQFTPAIDALLKG